MATVMTTTDMMLLKAASQAFIRSCKGRVFSVLFQKKDGTITVRNARAKVLKHLVGGEDKLANSSAVAFWSNNDQGWRSFKAENLIHIKCGDKVFKGPLSNEEAFKNLIGELLK